MVKKLSISLAKIKIMDFSTKIKYILSKIRQQYLELVIWVIALVVLYFMQTTTASKSLCIFSWMGIQQCPGCGIGHSINAALHLQFAGSFKYHPMGIIAIVIIFNRIKQLAFKSIKNTHVQQPNY